MGGIGPDGQQVGGPRLQSRGLVVPAGVPAPPATVDAAAWSLVDLDTGDVLAGRDVHGRYPPASILKILTAVTLLPTLPGDEVMTASQAAVHTECACTGLLAGGTYTVDNLFSGLLLVSGNDTAVALSEAYGGVAQTVAAMNTEAVKLGAYDTFVQTPSGLDGWQQLTSAYDMAMFLQAAVDNPRFVAYDQQPSVVIPAQRANGVAIDAVKLVNQTNNFLTQVPGAIAAKIGYTDAAQHTYVAAAQRNGRRLGVVLLRGQNYPTGQWQQAAALLDWGFALPAATSVGQLDAPPPPLITKATPAVTSAPERPRIASKAQSSGIGWWPVAGALALAGTLAVLELARRRRRTLITARGRRVAGS
jgi:D-alanyl-D-alanine carboxypeptidase (penicillin-binding protein 5/6)